MTVKARFTNLAQVFTFFLNIVGVHAEHPSTEVLICTYAFDDEPVQVWDCTDGSDMPGDLHRALRRLVKPNSRIKMVWHNGSMFDRLIMKHCWGFDIPVSNTIDTMIWAFRHALPGSLDALCEVLGRVRR